MIGGVVRVTTASNRGRAQRLEHGPGVEAQVVGHPGQGAAPAQRGRAARGGCARPRGPRTPAARARRAGSGPGAEHVALVAALGQRLGQVGQVLRRRGMIGPVILVDEQDLLAGGPRRRRGPAKCGAGGTRSPGGFDDQPHGAVGRSIGRGVIARHPWRNQRRGLTISLRSLGVEASMRGIAVPRRRGCEPVGPSPGEGPGDRPVAEVRRGRAQTLANGFWNSISLAARTSSAMPRSRSIVVSKPFLRIFS